MVFFEPEWWRMRKKHSEAQKLMTVLFMLYQNATHNTLTLSVHSSPSISVSHSDMPLTMEVVMLLAVQLHLHTFLYKAHCGFSVRRLEVFSCPIMWKIWYRQYRQYRRHITSLADGKRLWVNMRLNGLNGCVVQQASRQDLFLNNHRRRGSWLKPGF